MPASPAFYDLIEVDYVAIGGFGGRAVACALQRWHAASRNECPDFLYTLDSASAR